MLPFVQIAQAVHLNWMSDGVWMKNWWAKKMVFFFLKKVVDWKNTFISKIMKCWKYPFHVADFPRKKKIWNWFKLWSHRLNRRFCETLTVLPETIAFDRMSKLQIKFKIKLKIKLKIRRVIKSYIYIQMAKHCSCLLLSLICPFIYTNIMFPENNHVRCIAFLIDQLMGVWCQNDD